MSLIKCPECNNEVSTLAKNCPNYGCPICEIEMKQNESETIENNKTRKSLKNIFSNRKFRIFAICVFSIVLVVIIISIIINNTGGYNYRKNGIFGFEPAIKWDMDISKVDKLGLGENDSNSEEYLSYDNIKFLDKITGDLFVGFDYEGTGEIKTIQFVISDKKSPDEISAIISEELGEPIHRDNFNNKTLDIPKHMWLYGKNQYIILEKHKQWSETRINWVIANPEDIDIAKNLLSVVESDEDFNETYNTLLNRIKYENCSIVNVIDDLGVKEYEINKAKNDDVSVIISGYSYDDVDFIENIKLFGLEAKAKYHCKNPYDDNYPDFIGKVEYVSFSFVKEPTEEEQQKILDILSNYNANDNEEEKEEYLPIKIHYNTESPQYISCSVNDEYYLINPEYGYDEATDEVSDFSDCDVKILHLSLDNTKHKVSEYSDAAKSCWSLAKDKVKVRLKAPDSATFSDDYLIVRTGNTYEVTSYVDAQNSFGAKIRTYFVVKINRTGNSYGVDDITFSK